MKKLIILSFTISVLAACNSKNAKTEAVQADSTTTETPGDATAVDTTATKGTVAELYACPMHPEVTGEKDSECSKCGMPLTEPVK